nr:hypothetical protein [Bacteroidota bacterium]
MKKTRNQTHPGTPYKAHYHTVDENKKSIAFGIIADSHINCTNCLNSDGDHIKRNQRIISDMNYDISHWGQNENFIVHLGDAIDAENVQNLVAFRQLYEKNYPGDDGGAIAGCIDSDYKAYSEGYRINLPVYVNIGNHGAASETDGWNYMRDYVTDRMKHFYKNDDYHNYDCYYWKVGRFLFIHAGLSVCSYAKEKDGDKSVFDEDKINWIKNVLETHAPDSTMGIFILQHYGWESFSNEARWWTDDMRAKMINLLCRRDLETQIAHPYNVLGILTGHNHSQTHIRIFAGFTEDGDEVWFDNYVFDDSGAESNYGYSHLWVDNGDTLYIHYKKYNGSSSDGWDKSKGKKITILD